MQNTLNKKHRGFTLIELIVVIAVIGILVLFATPKLLGYTKDAKVARIKSDTKVAESVIEHYIIRHEDLPDGLTQVDVAAALSDGRLWESSNLAETIHGDPTEYVDITEMDEIKQIKSKLDGQLVANGIGNVYYIHPTVIDGGEATPGLTIAEDQIYREGVTTLASIWGNDAKEVMAMVTALEGVGVSVPTQEDALSLYQDLKTTDPNLLNKMIAVQPQIWTGNYNEAVSDLNSIKDDTATWLTGLFGSLQTGSNTMSNTTVHDIKESMLTMSETGTYTGYFTYIPGLYIDIYTVEFNKETGNIRVNGHEKIISKTGDSLSNIKLWQVTGRNDVIVSYQAQGSYSNYTVFSESLMASLRITQGTIPDSGPTITASISTGAPILNGSYDAVTDRRYPEAPWLGAYPGTWQDVKIAKDDSNDIYLGTIDRYINDIVNVLTWDNLNATDAGYYGGGLSTMTTLTVTSGGLLEVIVP